MEEKFSFLQKYKEKEKCVAVWFASEIYTQVWCFGGVGGWFFGFVQV